ncbi:N-acetylmuramoyl-L-alanine amidase [Bacillus massilinigeriensis]|uniref:N-acetylmuramoyl-L-alanine amidase n=1 Tax=Bacillus massilionigeriensis TaxID=1805475 RepID=UPI000A000C64|nr:N-acetylmuramoyl-L-alanine amidase [Bacillus massilionigeriensis]
MFKQRFIRLTTSFFLVCILFHPSFAKAKNTVVIITSEIVNIREGPGLENRIIAKASKGEIYSVIKEDGAWSQIQFGNGQNGWVANWLLAKASTSEQTKEHVQLAVSNADNLRVREAPNTESEIIGIINQGEGVKVLQINGDWINIETPSGSGWVYKEYMILGGKPPEINEESGQEVNHQESSQVEKIIEEKNVVILHDHTNIRTGPDVSYEMIQKANTGDTFQIIEEEGNWYKIRLTGGEIGYVAGWIVSIEKPYTGEVKKQSLQDKIIVIDPGHGGKDRGTTGISGVIEKDLTIRTANLLFEQLRKAGARPILTRTTDSFLSLPSRVKLAGTEHADAFISIHYDSILDSSIHGVTSYYYHSYQKPLAVEVHSALSGISSLYDRGLKFGDYHVLRENSQKAVLLELGYLSNPNEEKMVESDQYQNLVSSAIFEGLKNYFSQSN